MHYGVLVAFTFPFRFSSCIRWYYKYYIGHGYFNCKISSYLFVFIQDNWRPPVGKLDATTMETSSDQGEVLTLTVRRSCHPGQEVVTVESNLPLDKLRKQLQHQCDGYRFLVNNTPISHNQESILVVRDVLPKLFHGFIPGSQFTFPGVDYTQARIIIFSSNYDLLIEHLCCFL